MPTLNYPLEEDKYKAKVVFGLVTEEKTGDASASFLKSQLNSKRDQIKALMSQENIDGDELAILESQARGLQDSLVSFNGDGKASQKGSSIQVSGTTVGLYLPMGLTFSDGVKYDNVDLGSTGAAMEGGLGFAQSMLQGVGSFVSNITSGSGTDLARLAGIQLSGQAGTFADEARAVQKLSGGLTLNPNERILFDRPNMRTFSFTFKFMAKSAEEAEEIEKIIKFFRTELYPDEITASIGTADISLGYKFPNKFNISFEYDGEQIPGLSKIKPCFLADVATTYNASQMAMHSDGRFMEVDMTLQFRETSALTRKDIEKGGY